MTRRWEVFFTLTISIAAVVVVVRFVFAGNLNPSVTPDGTMNTADEIYTSLVSGFDSSTMIAKKTGSALQIGRCIIERIRGNNC